MTLSETKAVYQLCLHWADHKHTCITLLAAFERCSLNCCCIQIYRRCGIKWEVAWILLMQDDSHSTCGASALMLPSFFRIYPRTCCALRCVQDVGLHYTNVKAYGSHWQIVDDFLTPPSTHPKCSDRCVHPTYSPQNVLQVLLCVLSANCQQMNQQKP